MLQKTIAISVLILVASTIVWEWYYALHYEQFVLLPAEAAREPGLYSPERTWSPHAPCPLLEWAFRYRIGLSRDDIRDSLDGVSRLLASATRPDNGWEALEADPHGLAKRVLEFERGHGASRVAACELYEGGGFFHVLFFDDAGTLVGAVQTPSSFCLSAFVEPAERVQATNLAPVARWLSRDLAVPVAELARFTAVLAEAGRSAMPMYA